MEVPIAFDDGLKEGFLELAVGLQASAETGFESGEARFLAVGDDESLGGEAVGGVVARRGGFALVGTRTGVMEGIGRGNGK